MEGTTPPPPMPIAAAQRPTPVWVRHAPRFSLALPQRRRVAVVAVSLLLHLGFVVGLSWLSFHDRPPAERVPIILTSTLLEPQREPTLPEAKASLPPSPVLVEVEPPARDVANPPSETPSETNDHASPISHATAPTPASAGAVGTATDGHGIASYHGGTNLDDRRKRNGHGAEFFGQFVLAKRVVYVIDRSSSMEAHGALDYAKAELLRSLERLPANCEFQVVYYHHAAKTLAMRSGGLWRRREANLDSIRREMASWIPMGGSDHMGALRVALSLQPDAIFLLTDGADMTMAQLEEVARLNRPTRVRRACAIHVLQWTHDDEPVSDPILRRLAADHHGSYRQVSTSAPAAREVATPAALRRYQAPN